MLIKGKVNHEQKTYNCGFMYDDQVEQYNYIDAWTEREVELPPNFILEDVKVEPGYTTLVGKDDKNKEDNIYFCDQYNELTKVPIKGIRVEGVYCARNNIIIKVKVSHEGVKLYTFGPNYGKPFVLRNNIHNPDGTINILAHEESNPDGYELTEMPMPERFVLKEVRVRGDQCIVKGKVGKATKLYACGNNSSGQLGLGDSHDRYEWTEVLSRESFLQILVSAEESDENKKPRPKLRM